MTVDESVLIGGVEKVEVRIVEYDSAWPDLNAYADAKTEVIESIIAAARFAGRNSPLP